MCSDAEHARAQLSGGAMAETTDELVLGFLRAAGVSLPPAKISSLGDLDSEAIVAACAHCLNEIAWASGAGNRLPTQLSSNPGARFRHCTQLASAISDLGFPGEVGFNSFLYPSGAESRKLLLFLVDRMPKGDEGDGDAGVVGGRASFGDEVRQTLLRGLEQPWAPPSWRPKGSLHGRAGRAAHLRRTFARSAVAAARRAERLSALEERLLVSRGGAHANADGARSGGFGAAGAMGGAGAHGVAPPSNPGGLFAHLAQFAHESSSSLAEEAASAGADGAPAETAAKRAENAERDKLRQVRRLSLALSLARAPCPVPIRRRCAHACAACDARRGRRCRPSSTSSSRPSTSSSSSSMPPRRPRGRSRRRRGS